MARRQPAGTPHAAAAAGHRYATAALDAVAAALLALTLAGSLYVITSLARRAATAGLRWSARPARRRLHGRRGLLAVLTALAAFWTANGQFRGW